ncbi:MAG: thiamine-phosphate kinase [Nanoarchaeota archaeon]|nr:thiamine-phosphate kinase [Nanoarchaeota archaeon]
MKLKDIGEFGLIKRISKEPKDKSIIKGIGDDCAVVKVGGKLLVITTDALVDGDHFSLNYFTPEQIGKKAIEINVSDIGSMGGLPKYALVSLVLPKELDVKIIERIYEGMRKVGSKYKLEIIGGNITHGKQLVIDIDMIGEVKKENLCLRGDAKPGDFILVSGDLGSSTAGLNLFLKKIKGHSYVKNKHLEPKAQFHKVKKFLRYIHAMIDVSDGLASEVKHICEESNAGAVIYADNVPIKDETVSAARAVGKNYLDYALYGGEDFELVFTVSEKNIKKVKGFLVGEITKRKGIYLYSKGKEKLISKSGYDHFK